MTEADTAREYDSWLRGGGLSATGYSFLAGVPGTILSNTPVFRLHETLALRPEHRLLDVGCGRGSLLQIIGERVRFETPPVGIDLSREMLRRAVDGKIDLAQAAATALPFADASFDVATCSHVVKHLGDDDLLRFFSELHRVLKPGGRALIWEFAPTRSRRLNDWNQWVITCGVHTSRLRGQTSLAALGIHAGFSTVETAGLRPFLYPPIPRVSLIFGKALAPVTPRGPVVANAEGWRARTGLGRAKAGGD
jgi:SAM-dependent methyltransferase